MPPADPDRPGLPPDPAGPDRTGPNPERAGPDSDRPEPLTGLGSAARCALRVLGVVCVGLGLLGVAVPGFPTTIFLIIALWAFARSSPRLHAWLLAHPRWGPPLVAWQRHGAIPPMVKLLAIGSIAASFAALAFLVHQPLVIYPVAVILAAVVLFIATRPGGASGSDGPS